MESIIKQIIDCPKSYVMQYYDNLKARVDIDYENKLCDIKDTQLKEQTTKEWIKYINIIDSCYAKCIKNTIPNKVVNQAKELLDKFQSAEGSLDQQTVEEAKEQLDKIKYKLENYLFSNDAYLAVLTADKEQLLLVEEGFSPHEVECLAAMYHNIVKKEFTNGTFDLLEMNAVLDENRKCSLKITNVESFTNLFRLKLILERESPDGFYPSDLKTEIFKRLSNLKYLEIVSAKIENLNFLTDLNHLEEFFFLNCEIKNFDSVLIKDLNQLTKLDLEGCSLKEFNIDHLIHLTYLRMENCYITELKKDHLVNLVNLEILDLSQNYGLNLEEGCINQLVKLKELNLSQCDISKLKENYFVGLENLIYLNLFQNGGIILEKGCFNGLKSLIELNLQDCDLNELTEDMIIGLENLENLLVSGSEGIQFQKGVFERLNKLKDLSLALCKLKFLNKDVYDVYKGLDKLEKLDLSFNNNICFEQSFFNLFKNLKSLDLSSCKIPVIKRDSFIYLNNLVELILRYNEGIVLEDGCFNGLSQLKKLDLFRCNILELKENFFLGLSNLEMVDLQENPNISFRNGCLNALSNVKDLKI